MKDEIVLLSLLKNALTGEMWERGDAAPDCERLINMAERHGVLPLLYDILLGEGSIPPNLKKRTEDLARQTVRQSYRLLFLCRYIIEGLESNGVTAALLKGVGAASYYPTPELRKAGDVDILLMHPEEISKAEEVLENLGCIRSGEQSALHHVSYRSEGGIEVELHTMLAEPFDNDRMNKTMNEQLSRCDGQLRRMDVMGITFPVLNDAFYAYELLLHMLQHFLRSGFGLKLLCDWVVFWNRGVDESERKQYLALVTESRIKGFSDVVTSACCKYLGLSREKVEWMEIEENVSAEEFISEIMEAEEFGKSSVNRMVTLRGNRLSDYVREFHHQTCLNFPRSSRCIICWPVLWFITLVRFLRNNRKIRKTSGLAILKKAGQRGKIIENMGLFKG